MWEKRLRQNYILPWHNPLSQRENPAALQAQSSVTCIHDACVRAPAHGGQWLIFDCSLPYLLRQVLSLNLELAYWVYNHASEFQGWGYRLEASCPAFYVSAGDPKWIPHACMAGTYWEPICHIFNGSLPQRGISKNLSFCWSLLFHSSTELQMHSDLITVILVLKEEHGI